MRALLFLIPVLFFFLLLHSAKPPENRKEVQGPGSPFQHVIVDDLGYWVFVGSHRPEPHLSVAGHPSPACRNPSVKWKRDESGPWQLNA
ncbi:hypothetical protein CORC01_11060 [Colletotrichum orchidophilum]|uniref:Uncharacterized protein n=1 Tax=Colletotrichum orchidophilum TaxID=1209926 RepID=A0A1G4AWZ0_9PEZI|nr:uncharacterized protein CORC01_11060 [Colletotrichum orchidophilum]OHE93657.1 hypothetical protein CORC01_11060 [Colletotrichum orchidophilum]